MKNSVPTQFTKDRQPSSEARRAGWAKKRKGAELARAILEVAFKGLDNSPVKREAAEYFGIPEAEINVEMMMHFAQARKAIEQGDSHAYDALMRRACGSPKETPEANLQGHLVSLSTNFAIDALRQIAGEKSMGMIDWDALDIGDLQEE